MRQFEKEMKDIEMQLKLSIDVSGLLTFADYLFDGLIVDWMVQGKIHNFLEQVREQSRQIRRIISDLKQQK